MRRALVALAVTYFALWACGGPVASMPPPVPMVEGRKDEVGVAPSFSGSLGACEPLGLVSPECVGPGVLLWYRHAYERPFDLGVSVQGSSTQLFGTGVMFRYRFVDQPRTVAALQVEGGWLYGGVGLPMAFGLTDRWWYHVVPQGRFQFTSQARLGTGLSYRSAKGFLVGTELGAGYTTPGALSLDGTVYLGHQL